MSDEDAVQRTVAPKQLAALIKLADQKKDVIQSHVGELGERVKNAVENGYLHKGAYGLMVKLFRMDPLKRADYIRSMFLYHDLCVKEGLFGDGEHTGDLADMAEQSEQKQHDADAETAERNAAALNGGIKRLEPDAEFDDGTSSKPSRRRKAASPLEGGDAPGTYAVTH